MLTKTAIYRKYASIQDYIDFADQTVRELQATFPNVQLRPFSEFQTFLDALVPKLVHKYLISSGTMKNCSGVSPDFSEIGCQSGFAVLTQHVPGHQRNIVLTADGPYMVDLSYIQFICKWDLSDKENRKEIIENYRALYKDPWKGIKVEALPQTVPGGVRMPHGKYDDLNPDPLARINKYNIDEEEEDFPERFNRFK